MKAKDSETKIINKDLSPENIEVNNILFMMEKLMHWAAIIESSDDAIMSKSVDGYITSWNKGAERLYGYTSEEIIGKPVSLLMPPERKDDFPYIMRQLQEGRRIEHYETQRLTKYGKIIHVSLTVSPIRDSNGTIIGASKIARDISDKVESEKRRDEFVSTASHELKTPVTSQLAFGQLLENFIIKNGDTEYLPYIQKINLQTKKLTKLIEDLLALSRVQGGKLKMDITSFNFDDLVDEIVENMQLTTSQKISVSGISNRNIRGDKERIGQVITNLLSNAIKYSPNSDKIKVKIDTKDDSIIFSVKDYGIGIPKEYHSKLFEKFYRVTGDDEKTFPGMGIGLHVSREIINYHNGKIWVESEKDLGSTFYFSIPIDGV